MSGLPGQHVQMSSEKHPLPLIACKNALLANAVICLHDSQLQSRLQPYRREICQENNANAQTKLCPQKAVLP